MGRGGLKGVGNGDEKKWEIKMLIRCLITKLFVYSKSASIHLECFRSQVAVKLFTFRVDMAAVRIFPPD